MTLEVADLVVIAGRVHVREQPLRRGNRQVALAAVLQFLALNGQEMDLGPAPICQAQKEAALDAEDFEAAKAPRDRGKELLAEKMRLERQLEAGP